MTTCQNFRRGGFPEALSTFEIRAWLCLATSLHHSPVPEINHFGPTTRV